MKSNPKSSAHHFPSNDALLKSKSHLKVHFYQFQGIWDISAISGTRSKQGPNTANDNQGDIKGNPKSSDHHSRSIDALLQPKSHLKFDFYLFQGISGISAIWATGPKLGPDTANDDQRNMKSNRKFSAHHFPPIDALLKSKRHLKVEFYLFQGIWGISVIQDTEPKQSPYTANDDQGDMKSNPKFSGHHFPSIDALLKSKRHLKVDFYLFQCIWGISVI